MKKNHILRPILALALLVAIPACTTTHVIPVRPYSKPSKPSVKYSDAPETTVFQGPRG